MKNIKITYNITQNNQLKVLGICFSDSLQLSQIQYWIVQMF